MIGIIVLLAAILMPVLRGARMSAYIVSSKSNLHQLHLETAMYQTDNNGDGVYGDAFRMGLPPFPFTPITALKTLKPPLAPSLSTPILGTHYYAMYMDPTRDHLTYTWKSYAETAQGHSVLYVDPFNNDPRYPLDVGSYLTRRVLGITVDGSQLDLRRSGDWLDRAWWPS